MAAVGGTEESGATSSVGSRLLDALFQALPALLGAIGFLGFVAAVGGAIEWVRFNAAGLPADQAGRGMPQQELVSIGAAAIIVFALAGAVAVLLVYALDRRGEVSVATGRGLGFLISGELAVALWYAELDLPQKLVGWGALIALAWLSKPIVNGATARWLGTRRRWRGDLSTAVLTLRDARIAATEAQDRCVALEAAGADEDVRAAARNALGDAAAALRATLRRVKRVTADVVRKGDGEDSTPDPSEIDASLPIDLGG